MQTFTLDSGWDQCRKDVRHTVARLRAAGAHGKLVAALVAALASWKATDTEREAADDAVDDANAVVSWLDEELDDAVSRFASRLLVAADNDRKAAMYVGFFKEAPSDVTRLALEAEVQRVASWRHVREEVKLPDDVAAAEVVPPGSVADQVHALDGRLARLAARLPADCDVIVAGLSDGGATARLRPVLASGPDFAPGLLYSPSTRQPRLIQSSDLTVTVLSLAGASVPAGQGGGRLVSHPDSEGADHRYRRLVDLDLATLEGHALVPPFFNGLILAQVIMYVGVWGIWKGRIGTDHTRRRLLDGVRILSVAAATVPVASFLANLIPWWRSDLVMLTLVASVGVFVAVITTAAIAPPSGRHLLGPMLVVAIVTSTVLAADAISGSRLQLSSMMGLQPVVGGRFYGMGNVTFALFVTSVVLAVTAVADALVRRGRRTAAGAVVAIGGLVAAVVDGHPSWGADGGGPPALLPGIAYLVLAVLGLRLTWRRIAAIGSVTAGLFLLVGFLDSLRPADQMSHLGRFFDSLGSGAATDTIQRKLATNWNNLVSSPLTLLVPLALVFVVYVLMRPTSWGARSLERSFERAPVLRSGLIAWVIVMILGFALNDSGVAIPSTGAMIAIPLVIAIATAAVLDEAR